MRLYDLTEQYNDLAEMLEQDADNEALQTMLGGLNEAFETKVESIVKLMRSKEAQKQIIETEVKRLIDRAAKISKEVDWLNNYVETQMIATGREKVNSTLFDIRLGKCPPAVNVLDESIIPKKYFVTKPAIKILDKRGLLEQLKTGKEIKGVEMVQRQTLRIK